MCSQPCNPQVCDLLGISALVMLRHEEMHFWICWPFFLVHILGGKGVAHLSGGFSWCPLLWCIHVRASVLWFGVCSQQFGVVRCMSLARSCLFVSLIGQRGESQNTQAFLELLGRDPPPVLKSRRPVKNAVSFASWLGARTLFWYYRDEIHAHLEASGVAWHGERVFSSLRELQSVLEEDGAEGGGLVNEFGSVSEDGPLALLTGNIMCVWT